MTYEDFKGLTRRTAIDKILRHKAFNIVKNPKYDGNQRGLASMVYSFFGKKNGGAPTFAKISQTKNELKNCTNQLLDNFKKKKTTLIFHRKYLGC